MTIYDLDIVSWDTWIGRYRMAHPRHIATVDAPLAMRIENTPFTSARCAGGMTLKDRSYTYFEPKLLDIFGEDGSVSVAWLMVRDDVVRWIQRTIRRDAQRARKATSARHDEPDLFGGV